MRLSARREALDYGPASGPAAASQNFSVRHYTIAEIAEMWNLSADFVRQLFRNEPGVLVLGSLRLGRGKRRYVTLRIPQPVVERVHKRLSRV